MAAVQWSGGKRHGAAEAKASMMHDDREERLKHGHSNPDIDLSQTPNNFSYRGLSYAEKCRRYDELMRKVKVKRLSTGKNATTTLQKLNIPIPKAMQPEYDFDPVIARAWGHDVGEILEDECGELLIDIDWHTDERHLYIDSKRKPTDPDYYVWSRVHGQAAIVPAVWEIVRDKDGNPVKGEDGKPMKELRLNGKKFSSRSRIKRINERIQEMTRERYGIDFMTGAGKGERHDSVEDLKARSAEAMREEERRLAEREESLKQSEDDLRNRAQKIGEQADQIIQDAEDSADNIRQDAERYAGEITKQADDDAWEIRRRAKREAKEEAEREAEEIRRTAAEEAKQQAEKTRKDAENKAKLIASTARREAQQKLDAADEDISAKYDEMNAEHQRREDQWDAQMRALRADRDKIKALLDKAQQLSAVSQEPDASLATFAKGYKRRTAAKRKVGDRYITETDADGKPIYEEHNCYDDWQAAVKARRETDRRVRDLSDRIGAELGNIDFERDFKG